MPHRRHDHLQPARRGRARGGRAPAAARAAPGHRARQRLRRRDGRRSAGELPVGPGGPPRRKPGGGRPQPGRPAGRDCLRGLQRRRLVVGARLARARLRAPGPPPEPRGGHGAHPGRRGRDRGPDERRSGAESAAGVATRCPGRGSWDSWGAPRWCARRRSWRSAGSTSTCSSAARRSCSRASSPERAGTSSTWTSSSSTTTPRRHGRAISVAGRVSATRSGSSGSGDRSPELSGGRSTSRARRGATGSRCSVPSMQCAACRGS